MPNIYDKFPASFAGKYSICEWRHATAIMKEEFPEQFQQMCNVLDQFELRKSSIVASGGGKSNVAGFIDNKLYEYGWTEKGFDTAITIDDVEHETPTHKIDCVSDRIALDIEWNNKTEFYDRDLNNFRMLHTLGAISVGVIVTRSSELQIEIFKPLGIHKKYGASTTHLDKLLPKVEGGGAGGCPLLVIGILPGCYVDDD